MCPRAPEPVRPFWFECEGLALFKQDSGPGFHFLTERVLGSATGAASGFGTVPANQTQPDPLHPAIPESLQFERVTIDRHHITNRGGDALCIGLFAQIGGLFRKITGAAGGQGQGGEKEREAHA